MGESKELRGGVMVIDQLRGGKAFSSKDMREGLMYLLRSLTQVRTLMTLYYEREKKTA